MTEQQQLEQAIKALENQREVLGDAVIDAALAPMHEKLAALLEAQTTAQQRKLATVLVMDIVDSTSICENLDPEAAMAILDTALQRLAGPVYTHGGRVTRFMGDGFLAIFGAPTARENEPEMAIRAGLQILEEAHAYGQEVAEQWHIAGFSIRIGINTGLIIIGRDAEAGSMIMGTAVNLAEDLESAAEPGTLLISQNTFQHVRGLFDLRALDSITTRSFEDPVKVYRVERAKPTIFRMSPRSVAGIDTNMVGRDPELLMLQNLFRDTLEDPDFHVVTVVGDAGVGKSRLVYEFEKWVDLLPDRVWYFKGRATPETDTTPYGLIRNMFANRFEIMESDSAAEVREKFRTGMTGVLQPDQTDLVGQLLGFDFSTSQAVQAQHGSEAFGEMALTYLAEYLRGIASSPMVMILEDVHWADDSSLDLLDYLGASIQGIRLMVLCMARPPLFERRASWGEGEDFHTQINLKPLSRRASRALVGDILRKANEVPDSLEDMIVDGAEGNPFYVEELIKMLIEDGLIRLGEESWQIELERLKKVRVPPTLTGVIQARLDSLPQKEKILLQRASVVGRLFWDSAVAKLAVTDTEAFGKEELKSLLHAVRGRELVFQRERSTFSETQEYIFKHALLRDITYETVLLKLRKVYHRQVATWLEAAAGERLDEYLGVIAKHYELGGDPVNSVKYLQRAGDRARLAYAHQEAVDFYRRALAFLTDQKEDESAARTLMKLGLVHHTAFDYERSRQAYQEGFALWRKAREVQPSEVLPAPPHAFRMVRANPSTLDSTMADDSFSGGIINQLFSGLVEGRLAMETIPDVARSWELSDDGRRYIFYLRDDVLWSDGVPVTAEDFVYAWIRILSKTSESPNASLLYGIKGARAYHKGEETDPNFVGVRALDKTTLVVDLEEPTGYFLSLLAHYATFPVPRHVLEVHGKDWTARKNIVTNGAFQLESWELGKKMTLVRNPDYHRHFKGNLERVELSFDVEWPDQLDLYEADSLDLISFGGTPLERDQARRRHSEEYYSAPMMGTTYVAFDVSRPPFDDPRVRRAFSMAANKVNLADVVLRGYEIPATGGFVPPGVPGHSQGISLSCDPEEARKLLAAAGYPGGQGFPVLDALTWLGIQNRAECLQEQWQENLGVEISWKILEFPQFIARVDKAPPHLVQTAWMPDYPDPDSVLRASPVRRRTQWRNEIYESLVEKARRVLDQGERLELYAQADQILVQDEAVVIPLTYMWSHMLVKPWVRKLPMSAINEWLWKDFILEAH